MPNRVPPISLALLVPLALTGCAGVRAVRTLPADTWEVGLTSGGPIVAPGTSSLPFFPTANTSLHARYGVTGSVDAFGAIDLTSLVLGVGWLEAGVALQAFGGEGPWPYVLVTASVHVATDGEDAVVAEQLTAVASWRAGRFVVPFLGWDTVFQVLPSAEVAGTLFTGLRFEFGRWSLSSELRWYVPWADAARSPVPYLSPGGYGVIGFGIATAVRLP